MVKYLKYFLLLIPFIFITNVNAAQYNYEAFSAQLFDNRNGTLYSTSTSDTGASYYGVLNLTAYGTGAVWSISSPTIILANHTYVLTANVSLGSSDLALSSINRIGLGSILGDSLLSYENNLWVDELYSRVVGTDLIQFAFKSNINASYIAFPFTSTTTTQTDIFLSYVNFEDLGETPLTQTDITNILNSQTTSINNNSNQNRDTIITNQNQNTQNIINNQNQNAQDIIDNQNQNTQQEIESQKVCNDFNYDKSNSSDINGYYLNSQGNSVSDRNYSISNYILLNKDSTYTLNQIGELSTLPSYCLYNKDKSLISCSSYNTQRFISITPTSDSYIRFSIYTLNSSNVSLSGTFCQNGNQALSDNINDLNDTLNDTSQPNTNQDINDMENMVSSDTPISDLITMPLTLIHAYINGVSSSCSPINLGNLYGTNLILPCINLEQRLGSDLWSKIDALFSLFMCYNIAMLFITAFDGLTSLRDDFEGLYQPRHADTGYQPKHGGGN